MKLGMFLPGKPDIKWKLAKQLGLRYAIVKAAKNLTGLAEPYNFSALKELKQRFTDAGFSLQALEGDAFDMTRIKLGLPGRDEDIEHYCQLLKNMGRLEIPVFCYNFMAGVGWYRNQTDVLSRGGALTNAYFPSQIEKKELKFTHEKLWDSYSYFIKAVLPTAQEAGVRMGLHPDDPPVPELLGYPRIFISADAFRKAKKIADNPAWGITFCQANFRCMNEDLFKLIPEFKNDIIFAHMRDIESKKGGFFETFHDNGPTDMVQILQLYKDNGIDCLMRPDHAPTMAGEDNSAPGYAITGRLIGASYLKGIMDALGICW